VLIFCASRWLSRTAVHRRWFRLRANERLRQASDKPAAAPRVLKHAMWICNRVYVDVHGPSDCMWRVTLSQAAAGNDRAGASTSAGAGGGGAQGAAGGGGGDAARGSASAVEWAAAATPEQLAVVRADAARLASLLVGSYADTVSAALSHMPEEAVVAVQGALADAAATLQVRD
jgi:hypothetical protein